MKKRIILTIFLIVFSAYSLAAKEKLHLKIGTYENSPKIFTNENGEIRGFWADITKYIARQENWEIEWVHGTWHQCLQRLENNEIDIMIDVGLTPARQERFAFSDETVHMSWTRIYKKSGSDIQTILDLEGKQIAGLKGSFDLEGPEGLRSVTKKFEIDCEIIEMEDYLKIFQAIENNEIDAGITDKDFGNINDINFNIEKTPIIFQPAHMQFAFPKGSELTPSLIEKIDARIKELKEDKNSLYYNSMDKYLGGQGKITIFPLWLKIIIAIVFFLIIIIFIFNRILKHQVVKKTAQLRKSEKQFRSFAENVPGVVSIYKWYPDGHREYIYQGPGLENIIGEELAKKIDEDHDEFFKLIPAEDFKALDEASLKALETDKQLDFEYRLKIDDSTIKWVRALFSMFPQKNGVILWQGIVYDITERKQTEEKLQTEHDLVINILESMSDAFVSLDRNWCYTYMNKKAGEIFNRDPKEMIGKHIWSEFPEGVGQPFHLNYEKAMKEKVFIQMEEYYPPYDKWFENRINPTEDGIAIFFQDITAHKQAEQLLRGSEEFNKKIIASSYDCIKLLDLKGNLLFMSEGGQKLLEIDDIESMLNKYWLDYWKDEDYEYAIKAISQAKQGLMGHFHGYCPTQKGTPKYWDVIITPICDNNGKVIQLLSISRDITEKKKIEEDMKKKMNELEIFNDASVDRELMINDLRKEINELLKKLGKEPKYEIVT